jgi:hypothetical protein
MSHKNENLYAAMRAYVSAAIELVTRKAEEEAAPHSVSREDDFFSNYWTEALYFTDKGDISHLPEYDFCLNELTGDPVISRQIEASVGSYSRSTRTPPAATMMKSFIGMGRREGQYEFDPQRFDREYSSFEEAFYGDKLQYTALALLQGLSMEDAVVRLSESLEIRRLTKEEVEPYRTSRSAWRDEWCAIRARYEVSKRIGDNPLDKFPVENRYELIQKERAVEEEAHERIEDVIDALRLYGKVTVFHSGIIHLPPRWLFTGSYSVPNRVLGEAGISFTFGSEGDVEHFPQFWHKLESQKVKKELSTAVRRFSYSCVRHQNEDKIIDLMIAAEALFLHGTREGEKRFRLALRAARFLGEDAAKQKEIYDRFKKAYDFRSKLVHGGSAPALRRLKGEITESDKLIEAVGMDIHRAILKAVDILSNSQATALNDSFWDNLLFG